VSAVADVRLDRRKRLSHFAAERVGRRFRLPTGSLATSRLSLSYAEVVIVTLPDRSPGEVAVI